MFTDLHELTQTATLMIVVSNEGDQLRVSVTPTQSGDKTKAHALRPLSLVGTPAELDADFGAALLAWQSPKKSLVQQAQEAASTPDDEESESASDKPAAKPKSIAKTEKGKPGPKKKGPVQAALDKADDETKTADAGAAEDEAEFELEPPPTAPAEPEAAAEPEPAAPAPAVVDTKTLNLF